jgi:hypothetical protein
MGMVQPYDCDKVVGKVSALIEREREREREREQEKRRRD